jgi:beta-phosphoglucomutase family hydrolase
VAPRVGIDWSKYKAVLFDLDGVLTDTARVHSAAWKETFDNYLRHRAEGQNEDFVPFDIGSDYRSFVDGKPRYEGVDTFLRSRNIILPWGDSSDPPGYETVCAIGNMKNQLIGRMLDEQGVDVYPGSVRLLKELLQRGMAMAVVTSSANATAVLKAAGLTHFFTSQVDGKVAAERGLRGKPSPDPFLEASQRLGTDPSEAVVVEDAISGCQAGRSGQFGLVIGVDRHGDRAALKQAGADLVVTDLAELLD